MTRTHGVGGTPPSAPAAAATPAAPPPTAAASAPSTASVSAAAHRPARSHHYHASLRHDSGPASATAAAPHSGRLAAPPLQCGRSGRSVQRHATGRRHGGRQLCDDGRRGGGTHPAYARGAAAAGSDQGGVTIEWWHSHDVSGGGNAARGMSR